MSNIMEQRQLTNRTRLVRLSAVRATLPGRINLVFEPAKLQCAKCRRENQNHRINHVHLLPVSKTSEKPSCERITKIEIQKNTHLTETELENHTRFSQYKEQGDVCSTNVKKDWLRHDRKVLRLRPSNQADITLHRDVKVARVVNPSQVVGKTLWNGQKKRRVSESTQQSVEEDNYDWETSPSESKLRRVGAFRLRNNGRRQLQFTQLNSEKTTNRRFSIFPDQKFGQSGAELNENPEELQSSLARSGRFGGSSQTFVTAVPVRMKTKLSRPVKISTQNAGRRNDTNDERYEISLQRCRALHGCPRMCKDCANEYLVQTSLSNCKSTRTINRTRSSHFHPTTLSEYDKENIYERSLNSFKNIRTSKSMRIRAKNEIGENNNVAFSTPPPSQLRIIRYKQILSASKAEVGALSIDGRSSTKKRRLSEAIHVDCDLDDYKPKIPKKSWDQSFRDDGFITLGSEAIVELLRSKQHFGSSMSLKKEKTKYRLLTALTNARKWRKPPVKKLVKGSSKMAAEKKPYSPHLKRIRATPRRHFSPHSSSKKTMLPSRNSSKLSCSSVNDVTSLDSRDEEIPTIESFTEENEIENSSSQAKFLHLNTFKLWMAGRSSDLTTFQQQVNGDWKRASFSGTPTSPNSKSMKRQESVDDIKTLRKERHISSLTDFLKLKINAWSFRAFLQSEFSEENLDFWLECEVYKREKHSRQCKLAPKIFEKYLAAQALREVNINVKIRKSIEIKIASPDESTFKEAQNHIYDLMNKDSFRRYLRSEFYRKLQNISDNSAKKIKLSRKSNKRHIEAIVPPMKKKIRMNTTEAR